MPFMKLRSFFLSAICLSLGASGRPLLAQQTGDYLFKTHCASCHEPANGQETRGPDQTVLRQMTPEHILDVLEKGAMRAQAAERSRAQRRTLAEYLSGKTFGSAPPDVIPQSAFCTTHAALKNDLTGPAWNGWGVTITNTRYQASNGAGVAAADVPRLKLKWAFGYPGATSGGTQPVVVGDRLYVGTAEGDIFSLDAKTGCVHWSFQTEAGVRSAINIGKGATGKLFAYFGDQSAYVYAVDAETGKLAWKTKVEDHPRAAITGAPALYAGHLYVPVSSREESQVGDPKYPCCQFRGSMVAVDASSGKVLWKTYTIPEEAHKLEKNAVGTQLWGPSGVPIWNTPSIDVGRSLLYAGTGNNYSVPATNTSDAVIAFDMNSGKIRWISQVAENDIWNSSCRRPDRNALVCPDPDAPDTDFANSPVLTEVNGRQIIVVGNKTGTVFALDPDHEGKLIWQTSTGKGSTSGGIMWGTAVDDQNVYAANAYFDRANPRDTGGISALDLATGRMIWSAGPPACGDRPTCKPSHSAAVTLIPGVLFAGTLDGRLRAFSTRDGKVLWEYDTVREYETVNGVKGHGGSMSNSGPTVVGGILYVNSGYSHHSGVIPGNALLAFSVE